MSSELLGAFSRQIRKYRDLWPQFSITVAAIRSDTRWINLCTRMQLHEQAIGLGSSLHLDKFLLYTKSLPSTELDQYLSTIIQNQIVPVRHEACAEVFLVEPENDRAVTVLPGNTFGWGSVMREHAGIAAARYGVNREVVSVCGSSSRARMYNYIDSELLRQIESALRLIGYQSFGDLFATFFPGIRFDTTQDTAVQIVAPLPFGLEYTDDGNLLIYVPDEIPDDDLQLALGFPQTKAWHSFLTLAEAKPGRQRPGVRQVRIEWQPRSTIADATLLYFSEKVAEARLQRWTAAATLRSKVGTFFDPDHKRLNKGLFRPEGRGGTDFEIAVGRLFHLLGLPVAWYGQGTDTRRPDLAGLLEQDKASKPLVIIVECTREKPLDKLSPLRERARELHEYLENEVDIFPIVATPADPVPSDYEAAAEHGIALVGREQLRVLVSQLSQEAGPKEVLEYLSRLRGGGLTFSIGSQKP
ncbi:MAG: hypothetical protein LAN37_09625 [Acidobacteriia bacterium]|nr:hypothetical protein [Terriglobia bacterium]